MTPDPTPDPTPDALKRVGAVLASTTGLRPSAATEARLAASLRRRTAARGMDGDRYAGLLAGDHAERQALVELLSVQETSWFRDPSHFDAVVRLAGAERHRPVVLWSAGTATGVEAWSLAIALTEAGLDEVQVLATDIADAALDRARAGRYEDNELRGLSPIRRARWLRATRTGGEVVPELRDRVRFAHHNVATDPLPVAPGSCTAIFCRNVFIYLAPDAVSSALDRFHEALGPAGHLFVGVSETLRSAGDRFELVRAGDPFAYRRRPSTPAHEPTTPEPAVRSRVLARQVAAGSHAEREPAVRSRVLARQVAAGSLGGAAVDHRAEGERAARGGQHARAASSFRAATFVDPDDVLAHFGLGLALDELGDGTAARRAYAASRAAVARADHERLSRDLEGWGTAALLSLLASKLDREGPPCR